MLHAGLVVSLLKMLMDWHSSRQRHCTRPRRNDHHCGGVLSADEVHDFLIFKHWTSFHAFLTDGLSRSTTTPFEKEAVIARLFCWAGGPGVLCIRRCGGALSSQIRNRPQPDRVGLRPSSSSSLRARPRLRPRLVLVFRSALCDTVLAVVAGGGDERETDFAISSGVHWEG